MNLTRCKTFLCRAALALAVLLPAFTSSAQIWPLPANSPSTSVLCSASTKPSPNCVTPAGLTVGYPPTLSFAGRFNDAENAHVDQYPFRTTFARDIRFALDRNRVYMMLGSAFVAYDLDSFMRRLGAREALTPDSNFTQRLYGTEYVLYPWDEHVYAEDSASGWQTHIEDGQDRLFGFDWDDRGLVYLAYDIFGWGIVRDNHASDGSQMPLLFQHPQDSGVSGPQAICAVKASDGTHYAVIGGYSGWTDVWRTEDVGTPTRVLGKTQSFVSAAKSSAADRVAIVWADRTMSIYKVDDLVRGGAAAKVLSANSYGPVTSDGTNFYSVTQGPNGWSLSVIAPSGTSYTETLYPLGINVFGNPTSVRYGAPSTAGGTNGYVAVSGLETVSGGNAYNIRLYKIGPNGPTEISFDYSTGGVTRPFWAMYYGGLPPTGFYGPRYHAMAAAEPFLFGGKPYLGVADTGLGDIWQIKAGESVTIATPTNFGTPNPNVTGGTGTPPFYGDKVTLSASLASGLLVQLNWNFGDNTTATATSGPAGAQVHQWSGLTSAATSPAMTPTVTATMATDSSVYDSRVISLAKPEARITTTNNKGLNPIAFKAPQTPRLPLLFGDTFLDASDGAIEGHYSEWVIDQTSTKKTPDQGVSAGVCGNHTLNFTAHYGPYNGSFVSTSDLPLSINNFTYSVNPFTIDITLPTVVADPIVFKPKIGYSSETTTGTNVTYTWNLMPASGTTPLATLASSSAVQLSQVPQFPVSAALLNANPNAKVTLSVTASIPNSSCSAQATQDATTGPLNGPDPRVVITSGCQYVASPCTITASSINNQSTANWVYSWSLPPSALTSTGSATFTPSTTNLLTNTSYTPTLTVTNGISSATVTGPSFTLLAPLCSGDPTPLNTSITVKNASQGCLGTAASPCAPGETFNLAATPYQWTIPACSTYNWDFGDSSATSTSAQPSHSYSVGGTYTVTLTLTAGSQGTITRSIVVGSVTPPPPPPPPPPTGCATMTETSGYIGYFGGGSGCTGISGSCNPNENVQFTLYAQGGYNFDCSAATYSWNFGDGKTGSGRSVAHAFAAGGNYTVTITASNNGGSQTYSQLVKVAGSTGSCSTSPTNLNTGIGVTGPAGCLGTTGAPCAAGGTLTFKLSAFNWTPAGCETYSWNFGDGSATATSTDVQPTHTYANGGTYTATLTVVGGTTATVSRAVEIAGQGGGTPTPTSVDFSYEILYKTNGAQVTFTPTVAPDGVGSKFAWDFGDTKTTTTSSTDAVVHTYANASGSYVVTLNVNDKLSKSRTITLGTVRPRAVRR